MTSEISSTDQSNGSADWVSSLTEDLAAVRSDQVVVWVAVFAAGRLSEELRTWLAAMLDEAALRRAARYRRPEDADRALVGHALLRELLGRVVDVPPHRITLASRCPVCGSAKHGKPYLAGWELDPPVRFNLSHSGNVVAAALTSMPLS